MTHVASRTKRSRFFEKLEDRSMMAGNVMAALVNDCLQITGDSQANSIAVFQNQQGNWVVRGFSKTTINNGQADAVFSDVSCIHIDTGAGNDVVGVGHGTLPEELVVNTGTGNDAATLLCLNVGSVCVNTGTGNDFLLAAGITTTPPEQTPDVSPSTARSATMAFDTGDGNDIALLSAIKTDSLSLSTGKGNDAAGLLGVCVDNCLAVDMGAGTDILGIVKSSASVAKVTGGSGSGELYLTAQNTFGRSTSDFKINLKIDALVKPLTSWINNFKTNDSSIIDCLGGMPDIHV